MATERVYKEDVYAISIKARVTGIWDAADSAATKNGSGTVLVFDRSVFFPEGGGQPCDLGEITAADGSVYPVEYVYDEGLDGDVYHIVEAPKSSFSTGDEIILTIDDGRRKVNMERHAGEHLLSGVFFNRFGGHNKGFHMGDDYITIDIDADGRMYTDEEIKEAERIANRVVRDNVAITTDLFSDAEAASVMPVRKPITAAGEVSIVTIGDPASPADCCACCGTHPASSGEIGLIKIYKVEANKGMNRIFFDAGEMALERCIAVMDKLTEITNRYSTSPEEIIRKLDAEDARGKRLREKLSGLSRYYSRKTSEELLRAISENPQENLIITHHTELVSSDELLKIGFDVIERSRGAEPVKLLLVMIQQNEHTVVLVSNGGYICGDLVKEHAFAAGGRGGGREDNARAVFPGSREMRRFIAALNCLS